MEQPKCTRCGRPKRSPRDTCPCMKRQPPVDRRADMTKNVKPADFDLWK